MAPHKGRRRADIPLPKPLPVKQKVPGGGQYVPPESEVLKIRSAKRTQKPKDEAYALIIGIQTYREFNGPRFSNQDARHVQRLGVVGVGVAHSQDIRIPLM